MPISLENRYDPIQGYNYTYWPDSKYFRNYRFSPPISWSDEWSGRSRVWFPYYWSTNRLFQHYMDYRPSGRSLREQRKTIYLDYPSPIRAVDYSYYPYSYRSYRPLSLYYNYYWPLSSLNRYSDHWPYYPYYKYLYYKYTLPSDRYYYLKGRMQSLDEPIREYRSHPRAAYLRRKAYTPLSLYCDYYCPIRGLFYSAYWPMYRKLKDFAGLCDDSAGSRLQRIFDDETRLIRAQTASLLRRVHDPVPRVHRYSWPLAITSSPYEYAHPARLGNDNYIHRLLTTSPKNPRVEFTTYYSEPVRKYIGGGHLACVSYAGERAHNRRPYIYLYEDPVKSDIQLLSYYINKFKQEKAIAASPAVESAKVSLNPNRPTRKFTAQKPESDAESDKEMQKLREARAARLAFIEAEGRAERASADVEDAVRAKRAKEAERLAEEQALAEEQSRRQALAKKEEAAKKAELARQEELAAQAAAERAAELERQAELARQEELAKQAEIEKSRQQEEERQRLEEQRRLDEEARAEEERKQLLRLEEIARQAEEEKEAELARQADELAELARQEAELADQARLEAEAEEQSRLEAEAAEQSRLEAELAELERKERELAELASQEAEAAERAREEAEAAKSAAEQELEELERQQAELDALEAEARALEAPEEEEAVAEEEQPVAEEEQTVAEEEQTFDGEEQTAVGDEQPVDEDDQPVVEEAEPIVEEEEEDEDARRQREMDELVQQKYEQAQMEKQAVYDDDEEEEPAIAEDTPVQSDIEE